MRIIAGEARGRKLVAPPGQVTRPALDYVREAIFSILADSAEEADVLDLFAGSGSFGLEALSRGAKRATFVENDKDALAALSLNIVSIGFASRCEIIRGDALYRPSEGSFDLVFMDPPFAMFEDPDSVWAVLTRVEGLLDNSVRPGGKFLLRHPPKYKVEPRRPPADKRTFGASTVLIFEKQ